MKKQWMIGLTWVIVSGAADSEQPTRIAIITRYANDFQRAIAVFEQRYGHGRAEFKVLTENLICAEVAGQHVLFVHGRFWSPEMRACTETVRREHARGMLLGASTPSLVQTNWGVRPAAELEGAGAYLDEGGEENLVGFLAFVYRSVRPQSGIEAPPVKASAETGIYHPRAPEVFSSLAEYLAWYRQLGRVSPEAPLVGITFFAIDYRYRDTAHIDALIDALERRGLGVIAVFAWPLRRAEPLLFEAGAPRVRLLLALNLLMRNPDNEEWLKASGLRVINLVTTQETYEQWRQSVRGLPAGRLSTQIGTPERTGATEPVLIAAAESPGGKLKPIPERIEAAAERAQRWVELILTRNEDKRLVLIYYSNPPGKGLLGASYLNLIPSLTNILKRLAREGYTVGGALPDDEQLKRLMQVAGTNLGDYAQGELETLASREQIHLWPVRDYETYYRSLPADFRRAVESVWGPPAASRLMTVRRHGELYFVIPGLRLGNVFLGPQPLRTKYEEAGGTAHDRNTPPPHSYVAAYLWYKHEFGAHALIHLGRHGTLEWLPGKDALQAGSDAGEVLTGNLPHLYFYLVDGGGEFLQVKRRSGGVLISHLTPLLVSSGAPPELRQLNDALENYQRTREDSPDLAQSYLETIRLEVRRLGLERTWGEGADGLSAERLVELAQQYVEEVASQVIPLGLHSIGSSPPLSRVQAALEMFIRSGLTGVPAAEAAALAARWTEALLSGSAVDEPDEARRKVLEEAQQWLSHLMQSPNQELDTLISALEGRYVPTGVSGDPLRTPSALPTGRNMHDADPRWFPTPAAWQLGRRMAESLLEEQRAKSGRYPDKVSMVLWYGETARHQGVSEAQALALLGVEPVWNGRGEVVDVRLIPVEELKRPRVDVVLIISGLYRDAMPDKVALLDKAVRLAASAPDDNPVARNNQKVAQVLMAQGVEESLAHRVAAARIFGPAPGAFGAGLGGIVTRPGDAQNQHAVAEMYFRNLGYAYGQELHGEQVPASLRAQLADNEVVIHSRSTNLYGVLDNDETFQFAGGLYAASAVASGKAPQFLISNVRQAGRERWEAMKSFLERELRTRAWNPKWIEAMKASGYGGARELARQIEHLYGLRATAPDQVSADVWQEVFDVYIRDKFKLELPRFFKEQNPHAQQVLAARLIEVDRLGIHRFSEADRRLLLAAYIDSVVRAGAGCYFTVCGHTKLTRYVRREARRLAAAPPQDLKLFQQQLASVTVPAESSRGPLPEPRPPQSSNIRPSQVRPLFDRIVIRPIVEDLIRAKKREEITLGFLLSLLVTVAAGSVHGLLRRRLLARYRLLALNLARR